MRPGPKQERKIIAVDPGGSKESHYSVFIDGTYVKTHILPNVPHQMLHFLTEERPEFIYVEGQFLGINVKSMMMLLESRIKVQTLAELLGIPTQVIMPKSWQAHFGLTKLKSKELKLESKIIASEKIGCEVTNSDTADSILLGVYALEVLAEDVQGGGRDTGKKATSQAKTKTVKRKNKPTAGKAAQDDQEQAAQAAPSQPSKPRGRPKKPVA